MTRSPLLLALLLLGCGGNEETIHVVGNVPEGDPPRVCTTDNDCSGPCHSGTCIDKVCSAKLKHPDGVQCDDGPSYSECRDGTCTLKPHDPEECGESVTTEHPSSDPEHTFVTICDSCSNTCGEINISDAECSVAGSCCEAQGGTCLSRCVACCNGEADGESVLRCTHPAI